jgi:hypothetical protein
MEYINGPPSFRLMLSCATMGLVISMSPCFAWENQSASQEMKRVQDMQRLLADPAPAEVRKFPLCDSLELNVCLDIYRRHVEQTPRRALYSEFAQPRSPFDKAPLPSREQLQEGTRIK